MRIYLRNLVKQLKNFSLTLDKYSLLIDKPWAMINEEFELQKLIFRKNGELIMSKNGKVTIGKWDYLSEARSIIIHRAKDIILCNEGFVDHGVLVLKKDGTDNQYFILANENIVPDLDVDKYLTNLRNQKLNLTKVELEDGRKLEVSRLGYHLKKVNDIEIGQDVFIDGQEVEDGSYKIKAINISYLVKESKIEHIYTIHEHVLKSGHTLIIEQYFPFDRTTGDKVFINGQPAPDGNYKLGFLKQIHVKDGKII